MFVPVALTFVAFCCAASLFAGMAARRCGVALAAVHVIANAAGWTTADWQALFALNLLAMFVVLWRPAGWLQVVMSGLFLAGAMKHLAFGFSQQSHNAEMVAWQYGVGIALAQAALLLIFTGGRLVGHFGGGGALFRRGLVDIARSADSP